MNAEELSRLQRGVEKYWPVVRWVETTGSTNDDLLREGEPGTVLIAGEQTASRGRLGRKWVSPKGAQLAMSMVVPVGDPSTVRASLDRARRRGDRRRATSPAQVAERCADR